MANKKPTDIITLQAKVKVLRKLHLLGCKTEKELLSLTMLDVLRIQNLSVQDIAIILELQRRVKKHSLFSYLAGQEEEATSVNSPPNTDRKETVGIDKKV
ncbi:MAG: hypothetical protein ACI4DK_05095 [Lachnospiraceae bacterium]